MENKQLQLFTSSCRLCLSEDKFQLPIFGQSAQEKQILLKIEYCLPVIKITEDDDLPKHICYKCLSSLDTTYEFWKKCSGSESILQNRSLAVDQRHYKRTPYTRSGHPVKGNVAYHSSIQYGMKLPSCTAVSQATYTAFDSDDSETDWEVFDSIKSNKIRNTTPRTIPNAIQPNRRELPQSNVYYNRKCMQQNVTCGRSLLVSQLPRQQQANGDDLDTSPDLLEIIERESSSLTSEGLETTATEQSYVPKQNSLRAQTTSSLEDRNFVSNFWRQSLPHQNNSTLYPKAKEHVNGSDKPHEALHLGTKETCQKPCDTNSVLNDDLLWNNLNIPDSWHTELAKYHMRNDPNKMDVAMQSPVGSNKNNSTFFSPTAKTPSKSQLLQQPHKENTHDEESAGTDSLSLFMMNMNKGNESEEYSRTRNLLKRFKSLQHNAKQ